MASIRRKLGSVLAALLLWPLIGSAAPIIGQGPGTYGNAIAGWSNGEGNFVVDGSTSFDGHGGTSSYSTATSLFSYEVGEMGLAGMNVAANLQLNVFVQGDGTASGNLLGGTLIVKAGAQGAPGIGAAPGQVILTGVAIDSAALPGTNVGGIFSAGSVQFLFDLTYSLVPLQSEYFTFVAYFGNVWGCDCLLMPGSTFQPYEPWGHSLGPTKGVTYEDFFSTHKVPEPETQSLILAGLVMLGFVARRRNSSAVASTRATPSRAEWSALRTATR